jgi:hypothetical protein
MKNAIIVLYIILLFGTMHSCRESVSMYGAFDKGFLYAGRFDSTDTKGMVLISSAASVTMTVSGKTCILLLRNATHNKAHNYFSIEQNHVYLGRFRIEGDRVMEWEIPLPRDKEFHRISIFKETEPGVGNIEFHGVKCTSLEITQEQEKPKIEFIGNSITCGMAAYPDEIPCGEGLWYDQHNAYCAYGPRLSRALNAEYMLSASSGCGIYRHWNRDHPDLPEIYNQTYLNFDTTQHWDFSSWTPDIVSICLGTNDLSDGDGVTPRDPFNEEQFTTEYIHFVQRIYRHYPEVQVVLLSSPMLNGKKAALLSECLERVKTHFDSIPGQLPVRLYVFENFIPAGCGYHPDCADQERMAEELLPLFKELILR